LLEVWGQQAKVAAYNAMLLPPLQFLMILGGRNSVKACGQSLAIQGIRPNKVTLQASPRSFISAVVFSQGYF